MPSIDLTSLRLEYTLYSLDAADVAADPVEQFRQWFDQALKAQLHEPYAMTVASASSDGAPTARVMLLRGFDERGFVFYTNYQSRKGRELECNPRAALLFYWAELERQVRIEGNVSRVSEAESDAYFASRPVASRIGAWVSAQSEIIAKRDALEVRFAELSARFGENVPRPPHWGGLRVEPRTFEFWQGRRSRLHDRIEYFRQNGGWATRRLSP
ncbi:MAG TPA: pyridoxamine 5'-phosphate oxidase [Rhodocyclaceae bacterium]|nr:pyridoxamine 5'-phosphate oxidase [Rhodocyclaceae bacterium]